MEIKNFIDSEYAKHKRPYFNTNARYGRNADTIIFWYAITPKGKFSKWFATLRFNGERTISTERKIKEINKYTFPKLPKGYTWSEPLLYSGTV